MMRTLLSELGLGLQLAVSSRATRLRSALTAAGIALGVAVLVLAASVPHALSARAARESARQVNPASSPTALRAVQTDTRFRGADVSGLTLQAVGARAPVPPGLPRLPGAGEMYVSPALASVLRGAGGAELRRRLGARVAGTIADRGLTGPDDLRFYRGAASLGSRPDAAWVRSFGAPAAPTPRGPIVTLLVIVMLVALLVPVGVFMAAAERFGSEERDRRLAALRLVGAGTRATARVAVAESLVGMIAGLALGALVFVAARPVAQHISIAGVSVFAADLRPSPPFVVLVALLVPLCGAAATLLGIRRLALDPLGASRRGAVARRRLGWRLVAPLLGFGLLATLAGSRGRLDTTGGETQAAVGVALVLVGLTALLPWLVEAVVRKAPDGPLPWLLAIRRLRSDEGATGRVVGAIALAVAGAIALQILFAAAEVERQRGAGATAAPGDVVVSLDAPARDGGASQVSALRSVAGVTTAVGVASVHDREGVSYATVAPCRTLAALASVQPCRPGSSFFVSEPGARLHRGDRLRSGLRIPADARAVRLKPLASQLPLQPVALTPLSARRLHVLPTSVTALVHLRPGTGPDDRLRDRVAQLDPLAGVEALSSGGDDHVLAKLRRALAVGAVVVLLMIGGSLLVATGEQLRARRRALAVLSAVGTSRSTMAWSILCQVAIPICAGLLLALLLGGGLGNVLVRIVHLRASYDWGAIGLMSAAGAGVIVLVTLLTLPTLRRMMSPEALRVE